METALRSYSDITGRIIASMTLQIAQLSEALKEPELARDTEKYRHAQNALLQLRDSPKA